MRHQCGINGTLLKKLCDLLDGYCTTRVAGAIEDDLFLLWPELPHDAARHHDLWCSSIGPDHRELPSSRGDTCLCSIEIVESSAKEEVHIHVLDLEQRACRTVLSGVKIMNATAKGMKDMGLPSSAIAEFGAMKVW